MATTEARIDSASPQEAAIIRTVMRYAKPTVVALIRAISLNTTVTKTMAPNAATNLIVLKILLDISVRSY